MPGGRAWGHPGSWVVPSLFLWPGMGFSHPYPCNESKEKEFLSTTAHSLCHERWPVLAREWFMCLVVSEKIL